MAKKVPYYDLFEAGYEGAIDGKDDRIKFIVFNVSWSGSGQMLDEIISDLTKFYDTSCDFFRVDGDKNDQLVRKLGIHGFPTVLLYRYGKICRVLTGLISTDAMSRELNELLTIDDGSEE